MCRLQGEAALEVTESNNPTHTHSATAGRAPPAPCSWVRVWEHQPCVPTGPGNAQRAVLNPHSICTPSEACREKQPCPHPCEVQSDVTQMDPGVHTRSWQGSVLRRCLILLHLCTASPRLWVWVPQLHPSPEPKAFHHKAIECFLPPQKGGVCCKPATFPSSHSPLSRSTVCLKSSPLTSDSWRADFLPSFPSLSSPCLYYLWSGRFFFSTAPAAVWKLAGRQLLFSPSHGQMRLPDEEAPAASHCTPTFYPE